MTRAMTGGKFVTLIDVIVISLIAAFITAFVYIKLTPEQIQHAGMSVIITSNVMAIFAVTGILYFMVRRIK